MDRSERDVPRRGAPGEAHQITAIPELLDMLNLQGAIVTIDAMGTQREIASKIKEKGGEYILRVKGNQGNLHTTTSAASKASPPNNSTTTSATTWRLRTVATGC
jgi:hypothetical protein